MVKDTVYEFIDDSCLSRGAAIAYYTLFSLAPILVIVIAIAGFVFGEDAARGALTGQIQGLIGQQGADFIQSMIQGASNRHAGAVATAIGVPGSFLALICLRTRSSPSSAIMIALRTRGSLMS